MVPEGGSTSAVDAVAAEIRRAVLLGVLPQGRPFSVRDLSRRLGVSHIPVREALQRLQGQGLVVLSAGRSAVVASLTLDDLEAVYRLRLRLEPELAARSAVLATPEHLGELAAELDRLHVSDAEETWQAHFRFHELLVAPAATGWDQRVLGSLWAGAERYTHVIFDPAGWDRAEREHRHARHAILLDLARARDGAGLEAELAGHLTRNLVQARQAMAALSRDHPAGSAPAGPPPRWGHRGATAPTPAPTRQEVS